MANFYTDIPELKYHLNNPYDGAHLPTERARL